MGLLRMAMAMAIAIAIAIAITSTMLGIIRLARCTGRGIHHDADADDVVVGGVVVVDSKRNWQQPSEDTS